MHGPVRQSRLRSVALVAVVFGPLACGGAASKDNAGSSKSSANVVAACDHGDTTAAYVGYKEFIKVTTPTPQRFLTAAGTDSAAADGGFRAMQDKGPSFFFSSDTVAQRKLREKLGKDGPYASLLIVQRGTTTSPTGDTVTWQLGGHFIDDEHRGQTAASRRVVVVCRDSTWKAVSSAEEATK